jgi:hypothetical protein
VCLVCISEQTGTFASYNVKKLVFITKVDSVYSAVRSESLHKIDGLPLSRANGQFRSTHAQSQPCILHPYNNYGRRFYLPSYVLVPGYAAHIEPGSAPSKVALCMAGHKHHVIDKKRSLISKRTQFE